MTPATSGWRSSGATNAVSPTASTSVTTPAPDCSWRKAISSSRAPSTPAACPFVGLADGERLPPVAQRLVDAGVDVYVGGEDVRRLVTRLGAPQSIVALFHRPPRASAQDLLARCDAARDRRGRRQPRPMSVRSSATRRPSDGTACCSTTPAPIRSPDVRCESRWAPRSRSPTPARAARRRPARVDGRTAVRVDARPGRDRHPARSLRACAPGVVDRIRTGRVCPPRSWRWRRRCASRWRRASTRSTPPRRQRWRVTRWPERVTLAGDAVGVVPGADSHRK